MNITKRALAFTLPITAAVASAGLLGGCVVAPPRPQRVYVEAPSPPPAVIVEPPPPPPPVLHPYWVWHPGRWVWQGRWVWHRGHYGERLR